MKILIVGEAVPGSLTQSFQRSFERLGHQAEVLDDWALYRQSVPLAGFRVIHRLFWRILALFFQKRFLQEVTGRKPDLILFFKTFLISDKTILKIKKLLPGAVLFDFNPDNPFNTWHHGNSNAWMRKAIPIFDAYFIWSRPLVEELRKAGAKNPVYLPFGYDRELHHPVDVSAAEKAVFGSDVAFIGSWDEEREEWLSHILDYDLKIWGNAWGKAGGDIRNKWQNRPAVGEDFAKVCGASKIVVNFLRRQNAGSHNMRTFEVPASRGFLLSTRSPEQAEFFEEGTEAEYFSTPEELKRKLDFYLARDAEREKIRANGYRKLAGSNYAYEDRAREILKYLP